MAFRPAVPVEKVEAAAYTIPTDAPESDGTIAWDRTTLVLVEASAGGRRGLGYSYAAPAAARLVQELLGEVVRGADALDVPGAWLAMARAVRNLGRPGVASMAISAVDNALWDLKARLLEVSISQLLGALRDSIPAYGSGGFTSYSLDRLRQQLGGWAEAGFGMVKMKVGRDPGADPERVRAARAAIGPRVQLFVDANGAYSRKQALIQAERFAEQGVGWFEEPVTSDDLEGLRLVRDRAPAGVDVAAGEYGYDLYGLRRLIEAGAVDVLQADATRCTGITGFLKAGALCEAWGVPLSAHCAPSLHGALCCALPAAVHLEYFHDHARIERMLFDGALQAVKGAVRPDRGRPGLGLELKRADAEGYRVGF